MNDESSTIVALLHDIIEDTNTTIEDLLSLGFDYEIIEAIKLLTKPKDIEYLDYVKLVKKMNWQEK